MLNLRFAVICAIAMPGIACADVVIDTSIDFTELGRSEFIDAAEELTQAMWEPSFTLFARLDPAIADAIPSYERGEEFREIYGCIFDTLSEQGTLNDMNVVRDGGVEALAYIQEHPELNLMTIADHDEYLENAMPPDSYLGASQTCGLFELNSDIMRESGIADLMREIAENAN